MHVCCFCDFCVYVSVSISGCFAEFWKYFPFAIRSLAHSSLWIMLLWHFCQELVRLNKSYSSWHISPFLFIFRSSYSWCHILSSWIPGATLPRRDSASFGNELDEHLGGCYGLWCFAHRQRPKVFLCYLVHFFLIYVYCDPSFSHSSPHLMKIMLLFFYYVLPETCRSYLFSISPD